ncbi:MAG: hypothetical protein HN370_00625 [Phycisphaerales bacterium]|nr:hypothetical protein [Phycisphaerales bacterium]
MTRAIVMIGLMVCLLASAAPAGTLPEQVPAGTDFYAEWAGRNMLFDGSVYGSLLMPGGVLDRVVKMSARRGGAQPSLELLQFVLTHRVCIAGDLDAKPSPSVYGIVDAGGKDLGKLQALLKGNTVRPAAGAQVASGLPAGALNGFSMTPGTKSVDLYYVIRGQKLFFAKAPGDLVRLMGTTKPTSLGMKEKFATAFQPIAFKSPQLRLWLNTAAVRTKLLNQFAATAARASAAFAASKKPDGTARSPKEIAAFKKGMVEGIDTKVKALGLDKLDALAVNMAIVDKGMHTKVRFVTPAPHRGVLAGFSGAPLRAGQLAKLPGDTDLAILGNVPAKAVFDSFLNILREFDPKVSAQIDPPADMVKKNPAAFNLRRDVINALGDHVQLVMAPSYGGMLAGTVLKVEIRDVKTLSEQLAKLEKQLPIKLNRYGNVTVKSMDMRMLAPGEVMPIRPAWLIHGKTLYVALWPQVIASAVQPSKTRLVDMPDFKTLHARVAKDASGLIYVNTRHLAKTIYPLLLGGVAALEGIIPPEISLDGFPLPLHEMLAQMTGNMLAYRHDAAGITFEGYDRSSIAAPVVGIGVSVLLPAVQKARSVARETVSASNLRSLALAAQMYRVDKNRWPSGLADLFAAKCLSHPKVLQDPARSSSEITFRKGKLSRRADYVFLLWTKEFKKNGWDAPLAFEQPQGRRQVAVAFLDGRVQRISPAELLKILQKYAGQYSLAPDGAQVAIPAAPKPKPALPKSK